MRALLLAGLAAATLLPACEPTCRTTCKKLLDCEGVEQPRVALQDCESSCEIQQDLYEDQWDDAALADAFADAKRCVRDESCDAIADGVCYDEDLYIW